MKVLFQTLLSFLTILGLMILLGRQQIAEMTFFEYVNGITIGAIAGALATDISQSLWLHWFGLILYGLLTYLLSYLLLKNRRSRKWLEGEPILVIKDGKILEGNMRKHRFTMGEVMKLLREKDVFDISEVQFGVLENDGSLSVMLKPEYQSLNHQNKNKPSSVPKEPLELIVDGQVIYDNLRRIGKTGKWLLEQIQKQQPVHSIRDVFYAGMETNGKLYIDLRKDHVSV